MAGRARAGHRPPPRGAGGLGVSDLALFSWDSAEQDEYRNLAEVFPHLLGTTRVAAHRPIGVFWEIVLEFVPSGSGLEALEIRRRIEVVGPRGTVHAVPGFEGVLPRQPRSHLDLLPVARSLEGESR